jgi:cell division protein ZipA
MDSLRWILLGLGAVVIAGVYLWTRWQAAREERQYGAVESRGFDSEPVISEEPAVGHFAGPAVRRDVADDTSLAVIRDELDELEQFITADTEPLTLDNVAPVEEPAQTQVEESHLTSDDLDLPGTDEKLVVLYLVAPRGKPFRGSALREAFSQAGLKHGDMEIYHRMSDEGARGTAVFSIANLVEPGTFDPGEFDRSTTPGISLFMRLPGPVQPIMAFDDFVATARQLSERLGGELRDETRSVLSRQTTEHLREDVLEFERKQHLAQSGT